MKKKRLLTVFVAFAVVATMAIGLTACGQDNTLDQPEEQASADDSVLTEKQWIQAWADTLVAKNISGMDSYAFGDKEIIDEVWESDARNIEFKVDMETNYNAHRKRVIDDLIYYGYYEIVGTDWIAYKNNYNWVEVDDTWVAEPGDWTKRIQQYETEDDVLELCGKWYYYTDYLGGILESEWQGGVENSSVQGTISELFKLFTYDEATHSYSAELYGDEQMAYLNLTVSFRNGKLYNIKYDLLNWALQSGPYLSTIQRGECTLSYGGVSITIPEAIKANAVEM